MSMRVNWLAHTNKREKEMSIFRDALSLISRSTLRRALLLAAALLSWTGAQASTDPALQALITRYDRGSEGSLPYNKVSPQAASLRHADLDCKLGVLSELGWSLELNPQLKQPQVIAKNICNATTINQIGFSGYLRLILPNDKTANGRLIPSAILAEEAAVDAALRAPQSMCAYGLYYGPALKAAAQKLTDNHWYSFNSFLHSGSVRLDGVDGWKRVSCSADEKCFVPSNNAQAINSLYSASFASECGSGLHLAEYSAIYELFGAQEFNTRFTAQEIFASNWPNVESSLSVIHGRTGRRYFDKDGTSYVTGDGGGALALVGVPGYLGNVFGEDYLDRSADRGENFIIVSTTPAAAMAFAANQGFSGYNQIARRIWELSQGMDQQETLNLEFFGRGMSPNGDEVAKLIRDPFLSQTMTYVHDVGFKSLAGHLIRLARLNPRTPYSFFFYAESTHGEIFDRWLQMKVDQCKNSALKSN
jgi:hypothetical protein